MLLRLHYRWDESRYYVEIAEMPSVSAWGKTPREALEEFAGAHENLVLSVERMKTQGPLDPEDKVDLLALVQVMEEYL